MQTDSVIILEKQNFYTWKKMLRFFNLTKMFLSFMKAKQLPKKLETNIKIKYWLYIKYYSM